MKTIHNHCCCRRRLFSLVAFGIVGAVQVVFGGANPRPGEFDPSFNLTVSGYWAGLTGNGVYEVRQLVALPDNKIVAGGAFFSVNGQDRRLNVRLNENGTVDSGFHSASALSGMVRSVAPYKQGKLLVASSENWSGPYGASELQMCNGDGSIDASFAPTSIRGRSIRTVAVDEQNRILVSLDWDPDRPTIVRLLADGSEDVTFQGPITFGENYPAIYVIRPLAGGSILIGGSFQGIVNCVARLNSNGSIDESFNPRVGHGLWRPVVFTMELQADGKIVVGGEFQTVNDVACLNIARLNPDGTLDMQFKAGIGGRVDAVAVQTDQKILAAGAFDVVNGKTNFPGLARVMPDGTVDVGFDTEPFRKACDNIEVVNLTLDSSNRVLVAAMYGGNYDKPGRLVYRLETNGGVDESFATVVSANAPEVQSLAVLPDGSVLASGIITGARDRARNGFVRLERNGELGSGWETPADFGGPEQVVEVLSDGGAIVAADLRTQSLFGSTVLRFKPDGSLDNSWFYDAWGPQSMTVIHDIAVTPQGNIILAGMNQLNQSAIQQLLPDGRPDPDFHIPLIYGVDDIGIEKVACLEDGRILISGEISSVDGAPARGFARLHPNGTVENSFELFSGWVSDIKPMSGGAAILGGWFPPDDLSCKASLLRRVNPDGTLDSPWVLPNELSGYVKAVCMQANGKILLAGSLEWGVGTNVVQKRVVRLLADGAIDPEFVEGEGSGLVQAIEVASDGRIYVGGSFTLYNGACVSGLVCLAGDATAPVVATRTLPAVARPGDVVRVSILVSGTEGASLFAVDDTPPAEWQVSQVNNGGSFNPATGAVHFPAMQSPLSYDVVVASNLMGRAVFSGSVSITGFSNQIAGADVIRVVGFHPADRMPADFWVSESEAGAYADAWKTGDVWPEGLKPISLNDVSRAGFLWRRGTNYTVLTGAAGTPLCWVPVTDVPIPAPQLAGTQTPVLVRSMGPGFVEGMPLTVRLEARPAAGTLAYTVEEYLPELWKPVTNSGVFSYDTGRGILKWGPFYDDQSRVLEYQVIPAASTRMRQALHGLLSCDGMDVAAAGDGILRRTTHIRSAKIVTGGDVIVELEGQGVATPMFEVSDDLINWRKLPYQEVDNGVVHIFDPENTGAGKRFYRVGID